MYVCVFMHVCVHVCVRMICIWDNIGPPLILKSFPSEGRKLLHSLIKDNSISSSLNVPLALIFS